MSSEQHNGESHLVKSGEIHFSDELQQSTVHHTKESSHFFHHKHEDKQSEQQETTKEPEIVIPAPIESRFPFTNDASYLETKTETKYKIAPQLAPVSDDTDSPNEEVLGQDSKSLIFALLKQVRIGMDLSRVVLPTFILEPRSMLEKLTDFMTHAELMERAPHLPTAEERMLAILKWYLSGFYIKPKGVKKPYNPILGEFCRYAWQHADHTDANNSNTHNEKSAHHGSKTFYVGEQVSHHPPISAFYCSNRQAGFVIAGSILFKSKFYGTTVGTILEGLGTLYLLPQEGEEYEFTFPSLYAKGFVFGTLTMELAGSVHMTCKKTGWKVEMEFKQKPMIGGQYNYITGKVKHHNDTMYNFSGRWDSRIEITNYKTGKSSVLWEVTPEVKKSKLPKLRPEDSHLQLYESEKLWNKVSKAIIEDDQVKATEYKTELEQIQRAATKHRHEADIEYQPRLFTAVDDQWHYKHFNIQPWDPNTEDEEIEIDGKIMSKKK